MKKTYLLLMVFISFLFSCNNAKKGDSISAEKTKDIQKNESSESRKPSYAERGLAYATTTKAVLGKNLMAAIQNKGIVEAIVFCNEKAYPLTDSVAMSHHVNIKRVSDKPRNENNQANVEELELIETFKKVISNQEITVPIVKELDDKIQVFYPIITNPMCLQCHGKPNETIEKATLKKIKTLYPKDQAIGYNVNEVRGIWTVTFDK